MERRTFLKNIFGAAVVAAMPAIVVKEIKKFAPPEVFTPTPDIIREWANKVLYIFDDNGLIGGTTQFSLCLKPNFIEITSHASKWREFEKGPTEWHIDCSKMLWIDREKGMDYFYENKRFLIAFRNDNVKLFGEAYITNFTTTAPLYQEIEEDIMLQGTGQLIIGTDVNPRIEKQIREVEGTERSNTKNAGLPSYRPNPSPQRFA